MRLPMLPTPIKPRRVFSLVSEFISLSFLSTENAKANARLHGTISHQFNRQLCGTSVLSKNPAPPHLGRWLPFVSRSYASLRPGSSHSTTSCHPLDIASAN